MLFHSGKLFSTKDQDNDLWSDGSCALNFKGAWWYKSCHRSNLNGQYLGGPHGTFADGINWVASRGFQYSFKRSEMKLRPQQWKTVPRFLHGEVHKYELRSISFLLRIFDSIIISGAHQMEPPSLLISWVNPFPSRFINRTIFFCNALESHECACCLLSFLYFHWLFPLSARETSPENRSIYKSTRERVDSKGFHGTCRLHLMGSW